jgi:glycosyltransferase involved in cell wall biosynthesis
MKIGVDIGFIVQDKRGMGSYVRNMIQLLLSDYTEHTYTLFYRDNRNNSNIIKYLNSISAAADYRLLPLRACRNADLDVCLFPWNRVDTVPKHCRIAATIHDAAPFVYPLRGMMRYFDQRSDEGRFKHAAKTAHLVFAVSKFAQEELQRYMHIPEDRIKVTHLGISDFFRRHTVTNDERLQIRQILGFEGDFLLFVGANDERKNVRRLLQAYSLWKKNTGMQHKLVLCGVSPREAGMYSNITHEDGVSDGLVFLPTVGDKLPGLYRMAAALVVPSLYEAFCFPVPEAMASGTPVICSNAACLPEIAGDAALYFDPLSVEDMALKIDTCTRNADLRADMIKRGLQQVEKYTWEKTVAETVSALTQLVVN